MASEQATPVSAAGDPAAPDPPLRRFTQSYTQRYGQPTPAAVDGYTAMQLLLSAIRRATDDGRRDAQRIRIVDALLDTGHQESPLGEFGIEPDGNTTLDRYGVYDITGGQLHYLRSVQG